MVRGSKNLKKRGKKIQNTNPTPARKEKKRYYIPQKALFKSAGWNQNLSLRRNFEVVGLEIDPNRAMKCASKRKTEPHIIERHRKHNLGEFWHKTVDTETNITRKGQTMARRPDFFLSEEEIRYIEPLVKKYGDDSKRMFWDIKMNPMQRTEGWLNRLIKKYKQHVNHQEELLESEESS